MYYFDGKNVYEIIDLEKFEAMLNEMDLKTIKQTFKYTYQEELLNESMDLLVQWKIVKSIPEAPYKYADTCEYFKNYIVGRFDENIYNKMVDSFVVDIERQISEINYNKARLN